MTETLTAFLLEKSGTISTALFSYMKDVLNKYQSYAEAKSKIDTIEFYENLISTLGKDATEIKEFPPTLATYLTKAHASLISLKELLAQVDQKGVLKKLKDGGDFKNSFEGAFKQLQESYENFLKEANNPTQTAPWLQLLPINRTASIFWLNNFHAEIRISSDTFYSQMLRKLGDNQGKCCEYPSLFLKGYIIDTLCDQKGDVTLELFKIWLDGFPNTELKDLYTKRLKEHADYKGEEEKYARKLYREAKQKFIKATMGAENLELLLESKALFEQYKQFVKAGVPLLRVPIEDRHLYYLQEIEAKEFKGVRDASLSEIAGEWHKWVSKYQTKTPKQKANFNARDRYARGEAYYLRALELMGEKKDLAKEEVPPQYSFKPLSKWSHADVLDWLERNHLADLKPSFTNLIDGDMLTQLTAEDLEKELEIKSKIHRLKIIRLIKEWRPLVVKEENPILVEETNIDTIIKFAKEELEEYKKSLENKMVERVYGDNSEFYLEDLKRLEFKKQFGGGTTSSVPSASTTTTTTTLTVTQTTTTTP